MAKSLTAITATLSNGRLCVTSPYSPELPTLARQLGGSWSAERRAWHYDERDQERVSRLYVEVYGCDWSGPTATVCVLYAMPHDARYETSHFALGREIASRRSRDWAVRLGSGVTVVAGAFVRSGGSRQRPRLGNAGGVILLVRDVPLAMAAPAIADGAARTVADDADPMTLAALAAEFGSETTITPEDTARQADSEAEA